MRFALTIILPALFSSIVFAQPYTDFTGIWDGQCMTADGLKPNRTILIMDSDKAIQMDQTIFNLPDVRTETVQISCGDPMDSRETYCDVEHHYNYGWNGNKTEITLSHDWNAPKASPEYLNYVHYQLRMIGQTLEVTYQEKYGRGGITRICTYPKRR